MNVWDEFLKYARFEGEELRICDLNGTVYVHQTEAPQLKGFQARPEIDRVRLMQVLLESVPNELIRWGKALKEVVREDDQWKLKFDDGSVAGPFDLIVGADGAWSKVRKALTDVEPSYAGICGVAGSIDKESAGDKWDLISGMVGKGSNFCFSYGQSMMAQRLGDGNLKCSFYGRRERGWVDDLKANHTGDDDALKRILLENYQGWDKDFKQWIVAAKGLWSAALFELPVGQRLTTREESPLLVMRVRTTFAITVPGADFRIAHLMTPFAGEGVNAGMRDALDLVGAIEKSVTEKTDLDLTVQGWEESMFERSAVFMADTMVNKMGMFAQDAPYSFFAAMIGVFARANGYDVKKGWMSWLPVTKTAYAFVWAIGTFGVVRRRVIDFF